MSNKTIKTTTESISIDAVLTNLQQWRENKSSYPNPGIPDTIWQMIFALEDAGHRPTTLRSLFALNSQQYAKKRDQVKSKSSSAKISPADTFTASANKKIDDVVQFGEVSIEIASPASVSALPTAEAASQTRQAVKKLRSTDTSVEKYLDPTTFIVECIRPDGHRLKIHTTSNRLDIILQAFLSQEPAAC